MNMQFCAQSNYASAYGFNHGQGNPMQYPESQYQVHPGFPGLQYMYGYQQPSSHLGAERSGLSDGKTESKPRLSKEEVEKLEKVFQENPKPSSSVKAQLADGLGLERPRINNWFQNRRAKAKQERKQEEYEARRAAEKATSTPNSPDEDTASEASESLGDNVPRRMQPSSAIFPDLTSTSHVTGSSYEDEDEDDTPVGSDAIGSPSVQDSSSHHDDSTGGFQSPLSLDYSHTEMPGLSQDHTHHGYTQPRSMSDYSSFMSSQHEIEHDSRGERLNSVSIRVPSPDDHGMPGEHDSGRLYPNLMSAGLPSSTTTYFFQPHSGIDSGITGSPLEDTRTDNTELVTQLGSQGMPTPDDSFKSPPPPANIASRRNTPRPASLQTASLRSRSYNLGCGPKTAIDGKRIDPCSPASAMRRIVSATGAGPGRVQKYSMGPRSPMYFGRNHEALLQYRTRSPAGSMSSTFQGAAPPTPMTPALLDQQSIREPTVSSTCSDDGSFMLGGGVSSNIMQELKAESNLKTPPSTPGLMTNFSAHNYNANPFSSGVDFSADQPLLTPFFNTEFPDLSMRNMPSYVELSDGSLPTTPLYTNMMGSIPEQSSFAGSSMNNTQYDWDANESVISPKSSPGQPRSKQIQFTQNMTPQDYC